MLIKHSYLIINTLVLPLKIGKDQERKRKRMDLENQGQGWRLDWTRRMDIWRSKDPRREIAPESVTTKFFPILITVLTCVVVLIFKNCILGLYHEFRKLQKKRNRERATSLSVTNPKDFELANSNITPCIYIQ